MATLFHYQRVLEESSGSTALWATGTVPLGEQRAGQDAWARYESLVNEVLGPYAFHGLCTYDTQTLPRTSSPRRRPPIPTWTPAVSVDPARTTSTPHASWPPPSREPPPPPPPRLVVNLLDLHDLDRRGATSAAHSRAPCPATRSATSVTATNEVVTNGLRHGAPRSGWSCGSSRRG